MSKHHEQDLVDEVSGAPKTVTVDEPSGVESVEALAQDAARKAKKARKAEREELKAERKAAKKAAKKAKKAKDTKDDKAAKESKKGFDTRDEDVAELPDGESPKLADTAFGDVPQPHLDAADGYVFRVRAGWQAHAVPLPALCVACNGRLRPHHRRIHRCGSGRPHLTQ